ncbi:M24 family metallopeptidase [Escherichia coli]|nr:M24 family metallopeptidase [Escherichia coli]MCJ2724938.1 M24 family metallopeptidase [Escherichia coli]
MTLLASLRDWLKAQQLDAVLLSSRQNKQPHLGISTGSGYVVISRESAHILVDSRYYADVEARTQGYQLHLLDAMHTLATIVRQIIADEQLQTLGFEGQQVSWETAHRWQSELNAKLVSAESHPLFNVYQIVLQAQLAAISVIRPGVRCQQVDDAARRVITEAGYGKFFGHNTGHAIGIEVHEEPRFSPRDTTTLQPGMILTVEPGIYLPGQGGVRIEDVVLVTPQGAEVLYAMPKTVLLTGEA